MSASSSRADRANARKAEGSRGKISKPSSQDSSTAFGMTRDPLTEEFLRYLANERNASPRTLKAYRHALTGFRAENKTPWKKCVADDFRDYLFAVMKRGQARSYVRLQFSALRTFYQFLAARKQLRNNPVREVTTAKDGEKAAAGPNTPTGGRASYGTDPRGKEPICAIMDAAARRRHHGIIL